MKKTTASLLLGLSLSFLPLTASAAIGQGKLMFPESTIITSQPGLVVLMWNTDVEPLKNQLNVTLNAPGINNAQVKATVESNKADNDSNESMSNYMYSTLEFDLGEYVDEENPNYGEWVVTVPAGLVSAAGNYSDQNTAQTITFTWYYTNGACTITPSFGSFTETPSYNPETLKTVKITWDGIASAQRNTTVKGACAFIGNTQNTIDLDSKVRVSGKSIYLDLSELPVGKYRLFIPAAYLYFKTADGDTQVNDELYLTRSWFSVSDGLNTGIPQPPFESTGGLTPSVSNSVEYIDLAWPGENLTLNSGVTVRMYPDEFKEFASQAVTIPASNIQLVEQDGMKSILRIYYSDVRLNEYFWQPTRLLDIPKGLVSNESGETNPAQTVIFNVVELIETPPTWSPEPGVNFETIQPIYLSWQGARYINYLEEVLAYLEDSDGNRTYLGLQDDFFTDGQIIISGETNSQVTFDFSQMNLPVGKYNIVIPSRAFIMETDNGSPVNPNMDYPFSIGVEEDDETLGITTMPTDSEKVITVCTIDGKVVYRGNTMPTNLDAGLYIVNGSKTVIK